MPEKKPVISKVTERMLELMAFAISNRFVKTQKEWLEEIGFNPNNLSQVTSGKQGFTDDQKLAAVKMVGASMNWVFGLEDRMLLKTSGAKAIDLIKEGVRMLEVKRK